MVKIKYFLNNKNFFFNYKKRMWKEKKFDLINLNVNIIYNIYYIYYSIINLLIFQIKKFKW